MKMVRINFNSWGEGVLLSTKVLPHLDSIIKIMQSYDTEKGSYSYIDNTSPVTFEIVETDSFRVGKIPESDEDLPAVE